MDGWTRDINFDSSNISLFKYTIIYIHNKVRAASNLAAYSFKSSSDINTCGNLKGWEPKGYFIKFLKFSGSIIGPFSVMHMHLVFFLTVM